MAKATRQSKRKPLPKKSTRRASADHPVARLPFVKSQRSGRRCFWSVQRTGDYWRDSEVGRHHALDYLKYEAERGDGHPSLVSILSDMPRPFGAVELAFLHMISFGFGRDTYTRAKHVSDYWDSRRAEQGIIKPRATSPARA
jgi:hypothetical protein